LYTITGLMLTMNNNWQTLSERITWSIEIWENIKRLP